MHHGLLVNDLRRVLGHSRLSRFLALLLLGRRHGRHLRPVFLGGCHGRHLGPVFLGGCHGDCHWSLFPDGRRGSDGRRGDDGDSFGRILFLRFDLVLSLEQGETVMDARCYLQGRVIDVILRTRVMIQVVVNGWLQEYIDMPVSPHIETQVETKFGDQVIVIAHTGGITADVIDAEPSEEPRFEETTSCSGLVK